MNWIRDRLILAFVAATLVPLVATVWITATLLDRSLNYSTTEELDTLSRSLEQTGREFYQASERILKADAHAGRAAGERFAISDRSSWPLDVQEFWQSGESERFNLSGSAGSQLDYLERAGPEIRRYSRPLDGVHMGVLSDQYRRARELVESARSRDLRRGFLLTLMVLIAAVWVVALISMFFVAARISRPIQELTAGLSQLAAGNLSLRLKEGCRDETGRAIQAFNQTAAQLEQSRERLVYLTQVASWQLLARKMAHELKNSLTPIRLTVEEMAARENNRDTGFMNQAVQIVVAEIETLERRVRSFSEFSSEPTPYPVDINIGDLIEERVAFLKPGHPGLTYDVQVPVEVPSVFADTDQIKGILTNLLENAAEAAGASGEIQIKVAESDSRIWLDIQDSGPGLSAEASRTLFEPTITFKKNGMGLGLSIARKNALLNGGDLVLMKNGPGGAAFRVILPRVAAG